MKTLYTFLIILGASFITDLHAQIPAWAWLNGTTGTANDNPNHICNDAAGNLVTTGSFYSRALTFPGYLSLTNPANINSPSSDAYVAKYDPTGNLLWAKSISGTNSEIGYTICTDPSGNIYVGGFTSSDTLYFGGSLISVSGHTGYQNAFIAKYDATGSFLWARRATCSGNSYGESISADASGNVYFSGDFESDTISFGAISLVASAFRPDNVFLVKYDATGQPLWARAGLGQTGMYNYPLASGIDPSGNLYLAGGFNDTLVLGSDTLRTAGGYDIFVLKYDPSGDLIWAKSFGGATDDDVASLAADPDGSLYLAGSYSSASLRFGSATLTNQNAGNYKTFTARLNSAGDAQWAESAGQGHGFSAANAVASDGHGGIYIAGYIERDTLVFAHDSLLNGFSYQHYFLAKYDTSGHSIWGICADGLSQVSVVDALSADGRGGVYIAGHFQSPVFIIGTDTLRDSIINTSDIFVAKLADHLTGLSITNSSALLIAYPNPSSGTVYFSGVAAGETIEVYDMLGQLVHSGTVSTDRYTVNLSAQKGVYLYRVSGFGAIRAGKVIIN